MKSHPDDLAYIADLEGRNAQQAALLERWRGRSHTSFIHGAILGGVVGLVIGALLVLWAFRGYVTVNGGL